jgi:glycosyltransferase involved in cell wall biosynthesis
MTHAPKVTISVIMLCKDLGPYIFQAASSVLASQNVELVMVEPGSRDDSRQRVDQISRIFPEKVVVVSEKDSSPAEGLNNGLMASSGNIVGVLNADDLLLPGGLEYVTSFFEAHNDIDIFLGSGFISVPEKGLFKYVMSSHLDQRKLAMSKYGAVNFFHQGIYFRRDRFPEVQFNPDNKVNWDKEFVAELLVLGAKARSDAAPVAVFRLRAESITGSGKLAHLVTENDDRIVQKLLGRNLTLFEIQWSRLLRVAKYGRSIIRAFLVSAKRIKMKIG